MGVEIYEQADAFLGETEIAEQLRVEYGIQAIDRLDFDDDLIFDEQIEAMLTDDDILLRDRQGDLPGVSNCAKIEFVTERIFIN